MIGVSEMGILFMREEERRRMRGESERGGEKKIRRP
jgi:hypothetical protein